MRRGVQREIREEDQRARVRVHYAAVALGGDCCDASASAASSCCGERGGASCCAASGTSTQFGYTAQELASIPPGADRGLGCGHPTGIQALKRGQTVLDLGCGAGIDCFLAAKKVGTRGSVIGVDMTPEMLAAARENARTGRVANVEFRLGEIEHLPVADASVDVVLSNCVINLAPDQGTVYREAFRVLRPGGVLAVSDLLARRRISASERADPLGWSSCRSGALPARDVTSLLRRAGFVGIEVNFHGLADSPDRASDPDPPAVVPADIRATRPRV